MPRLLNCILAWHRMPMSSHLRSTTTRHYNICSPIAIDHYLNLLFTPKSHPDLEKTLPKLQNQTLDSNYWNLLRNLNRNPEQTLGKLVGQTLDSSIIEDVLQIWSASESIIGLRFFIWVGTQPGQRYSSSLFRRAVQLLGINRRPESLIDVLEAYKNDRCLVSNKTFKVILILCAEAKLPEEALKVLRKMGKKKYFRHEHVWIMLRNDPKWKANSPLPHCSKKARNDEAGNFTSSDTSNNEFESRPIGQKTAKARANAREKGKGKSKATGSETAVEMDTTISRWTEELGRKTDALQNMQKSLDRYADYKIFTRDTSRMNEEQLKKHLEFVEMIKEKYNP